MNLRDISPTARQYLSLMSCNAAQKVFLLHAALPEDAPVEAWFEIQSTHLGFVRAAVRDGLFQAGLNPDEETVAHFVAAAEALFSEEYERLCRAASAYGRGSA